jgi:hypothetical protein
MDEVREKAGKPVSGSVLLDEISIAGVPGLSTENLPPGE